MLERTFAKVKSGIINTTIGKRVANLYLRQDPIHAVHFLQERNKQLLSQADLSSRPQLQSFEDLAWLFTSNKANRGILRLDFQEAAYLFSLTRSLPAIRLVEIGRFDGGSTLLFASAADANAQITSIDIAPRDDQTLRAVLKKYGHDSKVTLIAQDANAVSAPAEYYDLVFIDGDHSYQAAHADYQHWRNSVKRGGHLLFHDCDYSEPGVTKLCHEIEQRDPHEFKKVGQVSSLIHFVRTNSASRDRQ